MITVRVEGLDDLIKDYRYAASEMPTVLRNMFNDLAFMIRKEEIDTVSKVFDRPKPQTQRNFYVNKATKSNPVAQIWFDQIYNKGFDEYMVAQVSGGQRRMKPAEMRLNRFFVPGIGAKMDRYGNMQGGQTTQILSRLGRFGDVAGYAMNQTIKSRKLRSGGSKGTEYFLLDKPTNGLKPGVYMRTEKRAGYTSTAAPGARRGKTGAFQSGAAGPIRARGIVPVMLFTQRAPSYRKRFPFYEVAQKVIDQNYVRLFDREIEYALRRMSR